MTKQTYLKAVGNGVKAKQTGCGSVNVGETTDPDIPEFPDLPWGLILSGLAAFLVLILLLSAL